MKIAVILDPLPSLKIYKDSTYAMMQVAAQRGHSLTVTRQEDLAMKRGKVIARCQALTLTGATAWYSLAEPRDTPLEQFDAVLMRKDPPFNLHYLYTTYLLEMAEAQGARIINRPKALRDYNEKLSILRFPEFIPETLVSCSEADIRQFLEENGDIIVKPLDSMGGASIFRLHARDYNIGVVLETMTACGERPIMAQRYIPEILKGDKRILLIDGKAVPYTLARIPKAGETRGNLAAGGTGVAQALSDRDREIAEALGPQLKAEGLILVGLDVIGDYLTEINVTSPTCMQEIEQQTGFSTAATMIDALEANCR
ncbi:MAG: glutathione synthase [Burkholderiales bacterium]